jgi:hypothetical protein
VRLFELNHARAAAQVSLGHIRPTSDEASL